MAGCGEVGRVEFRPGGVGSGGVGTGGVGTGGVGTGGVGTGTGSVGVASVSVGQGNAMGANAACIGEREDELLKCYLANVQLADNATARGLTSLQTAALLYQAGNKRAAKEVLCEQRD